METSTVLTQHKHNMRNVLCELKHFSKTTGFRGQNSSSAMDISNEYYKFCDFREDEVNEYKEMVFEFAQAGTYMYICDGHDRIFLRIKETMFYVQRLSASTDNSMRTYFEPVNVKPNFIIKNK